MYSFSDRLIGQYSEYTYWMYSFSDRFKGHYSEYMYWIEISQISHISDQSFSGRLIVTYLNIDHTGQDNHNSYKDSEGRRQDESPQIS